MMSTDWILLRGLAREARHWSTLPAQMEAALPGSRIFTPDNAGCGSEAHRRAPLSIAETVGDVRSRVFDEGGDTGPAKVPRKPYSLLGLSLGGMIAMEWAALHPDEVANLVIINTSAGDLSPPFRRLRPGALRILLGAAASRDLSSREIAGFRMTLNHPETATPELLEEWIRIQETAPVSNATFLRQLVASIRFRAPQKLACPVLILSSTHDRMVDSRCSRALLARYRTATLNLHPTAGHDLPLEDPTWVADRVAEWLGAGEHKGAR